MYPGRISSHHIDPELNCTRQWTMVRFRLCAHRCLERCEQSVKYYQTILMDCFPFVFRVHLFYLFVLSQLIAFSSLGIGCFFVLDTLTVDLSDVEDCILLPVIVAVDDLLIYVGACT